MDPDPAVASPLRVLGARMNDAVMRTRTFTARRLRVADLTRPGLPAVDPDDRLADVARRMRHDRVGAVAVMSSGRLVGIITERDLMRAVADGVDPERALASERMTSDPWTIDHDELATRAAERMIELGVRHLPVVEDGVVLGVISTRDLLRLGRPTPLEQLAYEPW
jgi:CBS domain-containing protein